MVKQLGDRGNPTWTIATVVISIRDTAMAGVKFITTKLLALLQSLNFEHNYDYYMK